MTLKKDCRNKIAEMAFLAVEHLESRIFTTVCPAYFCLGSGLSGRTFSFGEKKKKKSVDFKGRLA
ncbi:hypothetical protein H5A45_03215 [Pectobacterium polaris]|nr:hypothetical protein [Pectobacterium polaris]